MRNDECGNRRFSKANAEWKKLHFSFLILCSTIESRSVNSVSRDEGLLEARLDAAQAFLCLHAVAEVAGAQAEIRLGVGEVDGDIGEGAFELCLHGFGVVQGIVADFHEDMDTIAIERAVDLVERPLLGDETFDAAVLVNVHGAAALCEGEGGHDDEYAEAKYALHDE